MGYQTAQELAAILDLEGALEMHLKVNHYPPVPKEMVQPCIDAIDAFHEEDYQRLITLPEGTSWRGLPTAPAAAIATAHHLDAWLPHSWDCECGDCMVAINEDAGYEMGLGLE